jgi:predicted DNA-binding protein with PD1-like motif
MRHKLVSEMEGERTFVLVLDPGDDAMAVLKAFADEENITAASFTAIGAFSRAKVAWFDVEAKDYVVTAMDQPVEVLSLIGDVSVDEQDQPVIHAHAVLGQRDASTRGGHLMEGHVSPTLEVILNEVPSHLRRRMRPEFGIALIDLD